MQVFLHMSTLYILSEPSYFSGCGPFAEIQEEYPFYAMDFLQNVSIVIMYQMRHKLDFLYICIISIYHLSIYQ